MTGFDEVIDVRSPAEYAEDHIQGAINCPALDNAERARIGTLYKQVSPFAARKAGAVLILRHIAEHIEQRFLDRDRGWRPLTTTTFALLPAILSAPFRRLARSAPLAFGSLREAGAGASGARRNPPRGAATLAERRAPGAMRPEGRRDTGARLA